MKYFVCAVVLAISNASYGANFPITLGDAVVNVLPRTDVTGPVMSITRGGVQRNAALPTYSARVADAFRYGNKIVVHSQGTGNIAILTVIDAVSGLQLDNVVGYYPAISPSKRYVAYSKFYPTRMMQVETEDQYFVYDLGRSASENRGGEQEIPLDTFYHSVDVGFQLSGEKRENVGVLENDSHKAMSALSWIAANKVAYIDYHQGSSKAIVATIPTTLGVSPISIQVADVPEMLSLCVISRVPNCNEANPGNIKLEQVGGNIVISGPNGLAVTLPPSRFVTP